MSEKNHFLNDPTSTNTVGRKHSVDYYYLEAMKYLSCSEHNSDDSDCSCRRCRKDDDNDNGDDKDQASSGSPHDSFCSFDDSMGRERSWSHSMASEFETGTISNLPNLEGKTVGGRLKNRRYSDGMLIKPNMKLSLGNGAGHVQWADDCQKELTRSRPRKKYVRNRSVNPMPVKSILKNSSDECLALCEDSESDGS